MIEKGLFVAFCLPLLHVPNWLLAPKSKSVLHLIPNLLFLGFWVSIVSFQSEGGNYHIVNWLGNQLGFESPLVLTLNNHRLTMAILSTGIAWLIQLYSFGYLKDRENFGLYQFLLSAFTAAMVWLFLAGNLFSLLISWELVGIFSFLLVQFWFEKERPVQAGLRVLMINKIGDVFLIGALGLLVSYGLGGLVFESFQVPAGANLFFETKSGIVLSLFLIVSALVKSAQFPFNIWLKEAMEGPTAVSALLHSATMVTGGVWLLLQCQLMFSTHILDFLLVAGGITFLVSNIGAIASLHIKSILAFSTMAQLGLMVMGIGLGKGNSVEMHLFSHAFFKAALFLLAGILIHQAEHNSRRGFDAQYLPNLKGAFSQNLILKVLTIVSLSALAGIPGTSGFITKESILPEVFLSFSSNAQIAAFCVIQIGILFTSIYVFRLMIWLCFSKPEESFGNVSTTLVFPVLVLGLGSGFWLIGPNPLSSEGWVSAFWGHPGGFVFPDVAMILAGFAIALYSIRQRGLFLFPILQNSLSVFSTLKYQQKVLFFPWKMLLWTSSSTLKIEKKLLDIPLDFGGKVAVVSGHLTSFFDRKIVDGILHLFVAFTKLMGGYFWQQAGGKPQQTVFLVVVLLSLLAWFFI